MFDIGFSELMVIALVALIVLGPKRLPEVARTAGQWVARFRRFVSDVKQDFDRELEHADLAELRKLRDELSETRRAVEDSSSRLLQQANIDPAAAPTIEPPSGAAANTPSPATAAAPAPSAPMPSASSLPPLTEPPAPARRPKRAKKTSVPKTEHGGSG
jgi:sec-independent protein translocase protein TatB